MSIHRSRSRIVRDSCADQVVRDDRVDRVVRDGRVVRDNRVVGFVVLAVAAAVLLSFGAARHPVSIGVVSFLPGPSAPSDQPSRVPGEVLVKFKPSTSALMKASALVSLETRSVARIPRLDVYVIRIDGPATIDATLDAFRRNPDVEYAEPNVICRASVTPNDTLFRYQYALSNTGQVIGQVPGSPQGKPSADIKAPQAWEETKGLSTVVIGIVDTGVDLNHFDLQTKIKASGRDFINDDLDASDDHGHGTMVAGIAAAATNNNEGVAGVAWNAMILPVKVLDASGNGPTDKVAQGIIWAVDNGATVINLSLGSELPSLTLLAAVKYAYDKGVFVAAAAGNSNTAVDYPAAYHPYCFTVAATDFNDLRASWSNFGPEVDVAAPGERVLAPYPMALTPPGFIPYIYGQGTSMAAPHVAGLAALLKGAKPWLTPAQIQSIIRYSSDDVNASTYAGRDDFLGYGRINMEKALGPLKISK
jgi:thermitase